MNLNRKNRLSISHYALFFFILFFLLIPQSKAELPKTDSQLWTNITTTGPLNNQFKYWLEAQERLGEDISHVSQLIFRPGIGREIAPGIIIWFGYAWIYTSQPFTLSNFNENRIWQQLTWVKQYTAVKLSSRTRLEERFLPDNQTTWRLRELFKIEIPWQKNSKFSMVASDEIFVHVYNSNQTGIDQNRFFIGPGYRINNQLAAEIGYLNQHIRRRDGNNYSGNCLLINFLLNF